MARLRSIGKRAAAATGAGVKRAAQSPAGRATGRGLSKAAMGVGLAGMATYGFAKGFAENDLSDPFYQITLGDPKADEQIFGTEVSPFSLINPLGGVATVTGQNFLSKTTNFGATFGTTGPIFSGLGAAAGMSAGSYLSRGGRLRTRAAATIGMGAVGAGLGLASAFGGSPTMTRLRTANNMGLMNDRMFAAARSEAMEQKYSNQMPQVDGSLTFGLYNSRQGR